MLRHGHRLIYLILIQSVLILWLASWAVGDYLNNIYVRQYVDGQIQAYGLIMILVLVLGSVGGGYGFIRRRHEPSGESVQPVAGRSKGPLPTPKGRPSLAGKNVPSSAKTVGQSPAPVLSAPPAKSIDSIIASVSPPAAESGMRASGELHPAVAALKAELSERRVNLGLMSAAMGRESGTTLPRAETPPGPAPVLERAMERPTMSGPTAPIVQRQPQPSPALGSAQPSGFSRPPPSMPQPSTIIRPTPPSPVNRPPQPPQGARPGQPFPFGRVFQRPGFPAGPQQQPGTRPGTAGGNERFEDAARKAGFQLAESQRPVQTAPSPPAAPSLPRNVTTVITGVMPVKKKNDDRSDEEESNSQ